MSADFFSFKATENQHKHVQGGKEVVTTPSTAPQGFEDSKFDGPSTGRGFFGGLGGSFDDSKFDGPSTGHSVFEDLFGGIEKSIAQGASEWHDEVEHITRKIHDWFHGDDQGIV